jgi:hypothetical protein
MEWDTNPLRFRSQAFPTSQRFPSTLEFHGSVSCRNRSWGSSFRAFPSQKSRAPLEAAGSPAVIHGRASRTRRSPSRPVSADARDESRWPGIPRPLWSLFRSTEADVLILPELDERNRVFRPLHRLRSFLPPASPFTTNRVAPPRRPLLSWSFVPSEESSPCLGSSTHPA